MSGTRMKPLSAVDSWLEHYIHPSTYLVYYSLCSSKACLGLLYFSQRRYDNEKEPVRRHHVLIL